MGSGGGNARISRRHDVLNQRVFFPLQRWAAKHYTEAMNPGVSPFVDLRPSLLGVGSVALVTTYYLILFVRNLRLGPPGSGRPAPTGLQPPGGLSAAALRFLVLGHWDARGVGAALLSLAEKGHLLIENQGGIWTLQRQPRPLAALPWDEHAFANALFPGGRERVGLHDAPEQLTIAAKAMCLPLEAQTRGYLIGNRRAVANARWFSTLLICATIYAGMPEITGMVGQPIGISDWVVALSIGFFLNLLGRAWAAGVAWVVWELPTHSRRQFCVPRAFGDLAAFLFVAGWALFLTAVPLILPMLAPPPLRLAAAAIMILFLIDMLAVRLLWRKRTDLGRQLWADTQVFTRRLRAGIASGRALAPGSWAYIFALGIPAAGAPAFCQPSSWTVRDQWAFEAELQVNLRSLSSIPDEARAYLVRMDAD